jgi:lysozyme family protein
MRKNFHRIMDHVFHWEAGYVDHPEDPGGATNMGITIHTMRALELDLDKDGDIDKDDVKLITRPIATEIYEDRYWHPVWGNRMPSGLDLVLMDASVNSGPRASIRWVQRAMQGVNPDGYLGPKTFGAIERHLEAGRMKELITASVSQRLISVKSFRKYPTFGRGWERRISSVRTLAMILEEEK